MNIILPKNHLVLAASTDVNAVGVILEQYYVSFFAYVKCYDDGTVCALMNNKDIYHHHLEQEYLLVTNIIL